MSESLWSDRVLLWYDDNLLRIVITMLILASFLFVVRVTRRRLSAKADVANFKEDTTLRAMVVARLSISLVGVLALVLVWGIDVGSMLVFVTTSLTVLGVALFASWSLLSNITAFFVLLLHPSYRRGSYIRILDADNFIEGFIADVTLFNTRLVTENRETVLYPNNLLLGRPAIINPRERFGSVGKVPPLRPPVESEARATGGDHV